jgi:hypothetical protein
MNSSILEDKAADPGQWFRVEASEVLDTLRKRVSSVLSELGGFNRPADLQHGLALDKTLGRQIFKLACTAEPLSSGSVVPSRTSISRFLDSARDRGIGGEKLAEVLTAYEEFEKLVQTHAGDRVTFNSMVASVSGVDDEWLATDLQHRRNAFRAMSHTIGLQAKTRLQLSVVTEIENGGAYSMATVAGFVGMRILRPQPSVLVEGIAVRVMKDSQEVKCEPLQLSDSLNGYLLDAYSTKPLPAIRLNEFSDNFIHYHTVLIDQPKIGNTGTSTLLFGTVYPRIPADSDPLGLHITTSRPVEVLLFDVLASPGFAGGKTPTGKAALGQGDRLGERLLPLEGKFDVELLGKGPRALATPQVPRYDDLLRELGTKMKWNLDEYNAYRIRVEFPLYHSTCTMSWDPNRAVFVADEFRSIGRSA